MSRPDLQFKLARVRRGTSQVTLLAHQPSDGGPLLVAEMSATASDRAAECRFNCSGQTQRTAIGPT